MISGTVMAGLLGVALAFCSKNTLRRTGICHPTSIAGRISRILSNSHCGGASPASSVIALRTLHVRQAETVHSSQLSQTTPSKSKRNRPSLVDEDNDVAILTWKLFDPYSLVAAPVRGAGNDVAVTRPLLDVQICPFNDDKDKDDDAKLSAGLARDVSAVRQVNDVDLSGSLVSADLILLSCMTIYDD
mmetsp:Transcript_9752/g.21972  ORF Transcript_9752/g.21972 Transcript_9752/m.21972 type:complete len:188 (-) Transcript_9752:13-576(-)